MTKRIKLFAIALSIVLVVGLVGSIGATAAIWSTESGAAGNDSLGTTTKSEDWNVWAKYFDFIPEGSSGAILTSFKSDIGFNGNRLIIPKQVIKLDGETKSYHNVTTVSGQVFQISILKEMVEEIYIPYTVGKICANAFSGFVNLKKVVFEDIGESATDGAKEVIVDMFAFSGCPKLDPSNGIEKGNRTITYKDNVFFPRPNPSASTAP